MFVAAGLAISSLVVSVAQEDAHAVPSSSTRKYTWPPWSPATLPAPPAAPPRHHAAFRRAADGGPDFDFARLDRRGRGLAGDAPGETRMGRPDHAPPARASPRHRAASRRSLHRGILREACDVLSRRGPRRAIRPARLLRPVGPATDTRAIGCVPSRPPTRQTCAADRCAARRFQALRGTLDQLVE